MINLAPSASYHVVHGPLPPQPVGSHVVRRIERSNITPMDLAKFLQNRKVEEVHDIAKKICTAAKSDPDFKACTLKDQLRDSGFANIKKSSCDGGEKHQYISGLLQHLQGEFLNLEEGVAGPEATKFCKLIREPGSCLSMGIDCLIDEINVHKLEQEAGAHVLTGMSAGLPLSEGFPPVDGGTTGQAMNPGVSRAPGELQAVNPTPSAPPAYDVAIVGIRASELPEQQRCARGLDEFASQLGHYSLDSSGTATAMNNMAEILQRMSGQCALPKTTTVASGARLTSLAEKVRMTSVKVFRDNYVSSAGIGVEIVGKNRDIQPVVSVSWLKLDKFPAEIQERLKLARSSGDGKDDMEVPIVQVYLCASSEKALEGAEFTVELHSALARRYLTRFWPCVQKMIPISAELRMPEGLQQGADFHKVVFALHRVSWLTGERPQCLNASFSHGQGEREGLEKHNIGIQRVAPILEAMGVDRKTAMSREAGLAIPFGFTLVKQYKDAFERKENVSNVRESITPIDFSGLFVGANLCGGTFRGSSFRGVASSDESDLESFMAFGETTRGSSVPNEEDKPEVNERSTSGINPLPCTTEKEYTTVQDGQPEEPFAWVGGIIWVQTVTRLPGIETSEDLKQWVDKQKVDPINPVLPGIL